MASAQKKTWNKQFIVSIAPSMIPKIMYFKTQEFCKLDLSLNQLLFCK